MTDTAKDRERRYSDMKAKAPQHADDAKRLIFKFKDHYSFRAKINALKRPALELVELSEELFTEEQEDLYKLLCVELGSDKVKKLAEILTAK